MIIGYIIGVVFLILLAGLIYWAVKSSKNIPKASERKSISQLSEKELRKL